MLEVWLLRVDNARLDIRCLQQIRVVAMKYRLEEEGFLCRY